MDESSEPLVVANDPSAFDLQELVRAGNVEGATQLVSGMETDVLRRTYSTLDRDFWIRFEEMLPPEISADLVERLAEAQAVELLEDLSPHRAADIIEELPSDVAGDLLREMGDDESDDILEQIENPAESRELRDRVAYEWDTAGGLMTDQVVSFSEQASVGAVLTALSENAEEYSDRDVQYVYAVDENEVLKGVLPLRSLVLTKRSTPVASIMIQSPVSVNVRTTARELMDLFDRKPYLGLPVVDEADRLVGIVSHEAVQEALAEIQTEDYLKSSGIVGGEELRSMPLRLRCIRRLAWLVPNIVLNLIAASVIAAFQDTLQAVIALAVFLPIVSDMSGCSGNQAVAVSIRELTLGIIRTSDFARIIFKEGMLGLVNGSVLGLLLGTVAGVWQGNLYLGLVIGCALALNTVLSVLLGGLVPLALKRFKADPALASGPILTTCTDMCGFFLVLGIASAVLARLV